MRYNKTLKAAKKYEACIIYYQMFYYNIQIVSYFNNPYNDIFQIIQLYFYSGNVKKMLGKMLKKNIYFKIETNIKYKALSYINYDSNYVEYLKTTF